MHDLIAAPFEEAHLILRPGSQKGIKIGRSRFEELGQSVATGEELPAWLASAVRRAWNVSLAGRPVAEAVLMRAPGPYEFSRATWEINLGCDFDCEHCYLGQKRFEGLDWQGKQQLLHVMRDAGVLWLQITGGEPLIDPHFPDAYRMAYELGMQVEILSNGSRLWHPRILQLLTACPPTKLSLSIYGASAETYDGLTRRRGAFQRFAWGLDAAVDAGLNVDLSLIITSRNAHEADAMRAWADRLGVPRREYANMSPTIQGGAEPLPSQSPEHLTQRAPFSGCPAGHTFFHADPHGRASICKIGRDPNVDLIAEGVEGLARLGLIADDLMLRTGGCSGCQLSGSCRVCRPMAKLFQEAKAPMENYCQHGKRR
ncbi:radical SAM protein [Streptomyces inhibens]|uniref:radical SAM protein n=1 Tax=Streptomyces inhibens TaxID=2293571 RepID=UPI0036948FDB